jgi:hypothetical protein
MSDIREPFEDVPGGADRRPSRHRPSLFWPLVLIAAGALMLLSNLGYLSWQSWGILWRLWPLALIALGIDVLIGHRSTIGAIVSGLLILLLIGGAVIIALFAKDIPALTSLVPSTELRTEHVEHALADVERASISIDLGSESSHLSALVDSPNLIEGDVTYVGELIFDVDVHGSQADVKLDSRFSGPWFEPSPWGERHWEMGLSPDVPLSLNLDTGSGPCSFDLTGLQISDLTLDSGSGSIELALPAGNTFEATIDSGSGAVAISLPESVGARVVLDSGSGAFHTSERFRLVAGEWDDGGVWETDDFHTADHTIVLRIDQGSGTINID